MKLFFGLVTALVAGFSLGYLFHSQTAYQRTVIQETKPVQAVLTSPVATEQNIDFHGSESAPTANGYISKIEAAILFAKTATTQQLKDRITADSLELQPGLNKAESDLLNIYMERLLEDDPIDTIRFLLSDNDVAKHFLGRAFCGFAKNDTNSAIDFYLTMEESRWKKSAGYCILRIPDIESFARIDEVIDAAGPKSRETIENAKLRELPPSEAFVRALDLTGHNRRSVLNEIVSKWAKDDINATLTTINSLKNREEKSRLATSALNKMMIKDPERAISLARSYFPDMPDIIKQMIRNLVHRVSFAQTIEVADNYIRETGDSSVLHHIYGNISAKDLPEALAYAKRLPREQKDNLLMSIGISLVFRAPQQALEFALSLDSSAVVAKSIVFKQYGEQSPEKLEAHLLDDLGSINRTMIIQTISGVKADQDPEAALAWLKSYSDEPGYRDNLRRTVHTWIRKDPVGASVYIKDNFGTYISGREVDYLVKQWMQLDVDEATMWVSELSADSIAQQVGISAIANSTANQDPLAAFNLVKDLTHQGIRDDAIMQIARIWISQEPGRLDYIAKTLGLSANEKASIKSYNLGKR